MRPPDNIETSIEQLQDHTSDQLDQRILAAAYSAMPQPTEPKSAEHRPNIWKLIMRTTTFKITAAAILIIAFSVVALIRDTETTPGRTPFSLLSQAFAAEETLFNTDRVIHIVNEIIISSQPNTDPTDTDTSSDMPVDIRNYVDTANSWLKHQWLPICALRHTGEFRFDQLHLPAHQGRYTVTDESWYEPATGRFARIMTVADRIIFANSYDGQYVFTSDTETGAFQLTKNQTAASFTAPTEPAAFLGIAAGLRSNVLDDDFAPVQNTAEEYLADGTEVTTITTGFKNLYGDLDAYWLFRIRDDDSTIAEMEFIVDQTTVMLIRRVSAEPVDQPEFSWDLTDLPQQQTSRPQQADVSLRTDAIIIDVSVQHMIDHASSEPYIFAAAPAWASERQIADCLDLPSPPTRMFCITYRAQDSRHIVLVQSESTSRMLSGILKGGQPLHTLPTGTKIWHGGPQEKWWTNIQLTNAQYVIKDPPSDNRTGYVFETPHNTFITVAINGQIAEAELLSLANSLITAREYLKTSNARSTEQTAEPDNQPQPSQPQPNTAPPAGVGITSNAVIPNVTIQHMIDRATFEPYIFKTDPTWASGRQITDCIDPPSPGHRMFCISYTAQDSRHIVLVQSETYNKMMGPLVKMGQLLHTSPTGTKVWHGGPKEKWWTNILLSSARYAIKDPPSEARTGYMFETPQGTFPALAINGQITEAELQSLANSLVPAKQLTE